MIKNKISKSIFREYDIRGIINETLFEDTAYLIGRGFCSLNKNLSNIVVCRDGRLSSLNIVNSLIEGIKKSGVNVIDIGCGPTPMLYFASFLLNCDAGIMVTGSHNPKNHNGFKITLNNNSYYGENIQKLYKYILNNNFIEGKGILTKKNVKKRYEKCLLERSGPFPDIKVIWDCGNGATGEIISSIVKNLPGIHKVLFEEIDGNFPNHHPDPSVEKNLTALKEKMMIEKADLGISFDGDGDRIGILSKDKFLVPGDLITAFLSGSILKKNPNQPIVLDVKSSNLAVNSIKDQNGKAVIWKTGHSLIKAKIKEINAPLAGEMSGHIFFNDNWFGFDDAIYSALRCLQEIKSNKGGLSSFLKTLPISFSSPEIRIECEEKNKFKIVETVKKIASSCYDSSKLLLIDGVRVTNEKGWWLLRASNTQAALIVRAEGSSNVNLRALITEIKKNLIEAGLDINLDKYF
jgi:phosphomannomutase